MLFFSISPNKIFEGKSPSDKNKENMLCLRILWFITLSKNGTEFVFDNVGKDNPNIPSKGTLLKALPISLYVNPNI